MIDPPAATPAMIIKPIIPCPPVKGSLMFSPFKLFVKLFNGLVIPAVTWNGPLGLLYPVGAESSEI